MSLRPGPGPRGPPGFMVSIDTSTMSTDSGSSSAGVISLKIGHVAWPI